MSDLGSAYVHIRAKVDQAQIRTEAGRAGDQAGDELDRGLTAGARRGATNAARELRKGRGLVSKVGAEIGDEIGDGLQRSLRKGAQQAGEGLTSELGSAFRNAGSVLGPIGSATLVPVAGGLGAIVGQALAGGILAAPGLVGIGGSIAATLGLALNGVMDAIGAIFEEPAKKAGAAISNTRAVAAAEQALGDTRKRVAEQTATALARVTDAEKAVKVAQQDSLKAQQAINQARADAAEDLDDIARSLVDNNLDQRQAVLDLQKAEEDYAEALRNKLPEGAALREQASIALERAKKRLEDLKLAEQDLQGEQAKGIEGNSKVVAAKDGAAKATARVQDAEAALQRAQDEARKAQLEGQEQIKRGLAAVAEASKTNIGAATADADKYGDALKKLSPNAALFVEGLKKISGPLKGVQQSVQDAFFKPLTDVGDRLQKSGFLTTLSDGLSKVGTALGKSVSGFVDLITTPAAQAGFKALFEGTANFVKAAGPGLTSFMTSMGQAMAALAPAMGPLGTVLGEVASKFGDVFTRLIANGAFDKLIGSLMTFLDVFSSGLADSVVILFTELANPRITDAMVILVSAFVDLVKLVAPYLPDMAEMVALLAVTLVNSVDLIIKGLRQWGEYATWMYENVWAPLCKAWATAFDFMYRNVFKPVIDLVVAGLKAWGEYATWMYQNVWAPTMKAVGSAAVFVWENVLRPTWAALNAAWGAVGTGLKFVNDNVIQPVWRGVQSGWEFVSSTIKTSWEGWKLAFSAVGSFLKTVKENTIDKVWSGIKSGADLMADGVKLAWEKIQSAAKVPIRFVVETVYGKAIQPAWNALATPFGLSKLPDVKLPQGFARGGQIPGDSGMRYQDDRLASSPGGPIALAGGEFIVNAPATRRHKAVLEAINSGHGLAGGGSVDELLAIMNKSGIGGVSVNSTLRNTPDNHGRGLAVDFGGSGNGSVRDRVANYWARYGSSLMELLHRSDDGRQNWAWKNGRNVGPGFYGEGTMNEHRNHVHVAASEAAARAILSGATPAEAENASDGGGLIGALRRLGRDGISKIPGNTGFVSELLKPAATKSLDKGLGVAEAAWEKIKSKLTFGLFDGDEGAATGSMAGNAATIMSVGSRLGASLRDQTIAVATAYVESGLKNINYGDRDSLGLFQQRAPWGSAAARTNPSEAARMFFEGGRGGQRGLFDIGNRAALSMGQAAQAVQVSAFPFAYDNKGVPVARGITGYTKYDTGGLLSPGNTMVTNQTGGPEYILNREDTKAFFEAVNNGRGGGVTIEQVVVNERSDVDALVNALAFRLGI